ncbi:MAG: hypothetical protein OQK04_14810 [Kangiellaceae bacterium]|nr:hypothetical protein [Kangiellaceae bacterium]MCW8999978.1 hypothetical protein [Kangiellaceae bacterium]
MMSKEMPYFVFTQSFCVPLYLKKDGCYQKTRSGELAELMTGPGYIIVSNQIADIFRQTEATGASFTSVEIFDPKTNAYETGFEKMDVDSQFNERNISDLELIGKQFYALNNENLFVSPSLKEELEGLTSTLEFSKGLSMFG